MSLVAMRFRLFVFTVSHVLLYKELQNYLDKTSDNFINKFLTFAIQFTVQHSQ